ncbi:hypothetical protein [Frankia casuarinae]|uniref:hypothetical protein n=1 Tax=Frankia casuarinae (strain DSM 45818 / CECT 9043 / HFP020203 / CcI3) TaxID=106370 RepID=UPI0002F93E2F|nr:hypothetical protein [Frankia casuarinae]
MSNEPVDCEQLDISSLLAMLGEIPDPRKAKGAIYSLRYILQGDPQSLFVQVDGVRRGAGGWGRWWCEDPGPAAVSSL